MGSDRPGLRGALARALREPLVHFLLAGFALFALYAWLQPGRFQADASRRVELSAADVARIEIAFLARWQRRPTAAELRGLLAGEVRNEVLAREAIALGLDQGDVIVKRRLAQKMEFLTDDVSGLREPTPAELRAWFDANTSEFAQAPRITFRHVFFSTDRRGAGAEAAARRSLAAIPGSGGTAPAGDPFMFQEHYAERTEAQLAQVFGSAFAKAVLAAPPDRWSGPYESGLGWHVVRAEALRPGEAPAYDEVEPLVRERWIAEQREAAKNARVQAMLARYEIILPAQEAVDRALARSAAPAK